MKCFIHKFIQTCMIGIAARYLNLVEKFFLRLCRNMDVIWLPHWKPGQYMTEDCQMATICKSKIKVLHSMLQGRWSLKILYIVGESGVNTCTLLITVLTHWSYLTPPPYLIMSPNCTTLLLKTSILLLSIWSFNSLSRPIFTDP